MESFKFGGYGYVLHSAIMYSGRGESGNWRLIVKTSDNFVIYDDDKIPYDGSMADLKKYATDLIFMRKSRAPVEENFVKNYKIIENINQDQPRMVQISFMKQKIVLPETVGPNKFPRTNDDPIENMALASIEMINDGSELPIGATSSKNLPVLKFQITLSLLLLKGLEFLIWANLEKLSKRVDGLSKLMGSKQILRGFPVP